MPGPDSPCSGGAWSGCHIRDQLWSLQGPCPLRLVLCWNGALGRLTWAGAHRLSLPRWAVLASSAGGLRLLRGGAFLQCGGLMPWQRKATSSYRRCHRRTEGPTGARTRGSLKPHSQPHRSGQHLAPGTRHTCRGGVPSPSGSFQQPCLGPARLLKPQLRAVSGTCVRKQGQALPLGLHGAPWRRAGDRPKHQVDGSSMANPWIRLRCQKGWHTPPLDVFS